jgi:hypothetical protein
MNIILALAGFSLAVLVAVYPGQEETDFLIALGGMIIGISRSLRATGGHESHRHQQEDHPKA